jgi:ribosomal protein L7/L12
MNQILAAMAAPALACFTFIVIAAMKLSRLSDHIVRQEAKMNLMLAKLEIAFPPPPSAAIQAIARTQRIAAVKAYRQETGLGLKQSLDIIDQWRAKQP